MPVDNAVYDRMAESWWDEGGFLHVLTALNPARLGYMQRVLANELHLVPTGLRGLDVGCGGGRPARGVGCPGGWDRSAKWVRGRGSPEPTNISQLNSSVR